jgi:hypothetical protein
VTDLSTIRLAGSIDWGEALQQVEAVTSNAPREELPGLLAELERIRAAAWLRLAVPPAVESGVDRLLGAPEAASMLGIDVSALYRKRWPFRVEVSSRRTRYSLHGIERFIRAREGR